MTEAKTAGMANHPVVTIKLASTANELMQCYMLRAAVFMGEQDCPYWEEFDGNDYTASHLMLYVDGEPAASMRVRWFASFAKLERAIILKRYRSYGLFIPSSTGRRSSAARRATPRPICMPSSGCGRSSSAWASARSTTGSFISPTTSTAPSFANSDRREDHADRLHRAHGAEPAGGSPGDAGHPGGVDGSRASNPHAEWTERRAN